jgi:hypothetical protein
MSRYVPDRLLTVDDLHAMPDDGFKHQLEAGVLVSEPLPGFRYGRVMTTVGRMLDTHVRAHRFGAVVSGDSGFILGRRPIRFAAPTPPSSPGNG